MAKHKKICARPRKGETLAEMRVRLEALKVASGYYEASRVAEREEIKRARIKRENAKRAGAKQTWTTRRMEDPEYRARQRKRKRDQRRQRYARDDEYRKKLLATQATRKAHEPPDKKAKRAAQQAAYRAAKQNTGYFAARYRANREKILAQQAAKRASDPPDKRQKRLEAARQKYRDYKEFYEHGLVKLLDARLHSGMDTGSGARPGTSATGSGNQLG